MHYWLENDTVPHPAPHVLALTDQPPAANELRDYYGTRRLQYQLDSFRRWANENVTLHSVTRYLPPFLFFGSVGAVLIHFWYDIKTKPEQLDSFSRWMILLAESLPVLGGAVRTFRSAYEFARNTHRHRAKAVTLTSIGSVLEHATEPRAQFLALWFSEQTLENEHWEWLRLMIEAEWFG